jgi:hypothetical protein
MGDGAVEAGNSPPLMNRTRWMRGEASEQDQLLFAVFDFLRKMSLCLRTDSVLLIPGFRIVHPLGGNGLEFLVNLNSCQKAPRRTVVTAWMQPDLAVHLTPPRVTTGASSSRCETRIRYEKHGWAVYLQQNNRARHASPEFYEKKTKLQPYIMRWRRPSLNSSRPSRMSPSVILFHDC